MNQEGNFRKLTRAKKFLLLLLVLAICQINAYSLGAVAKADTPASLDRAGFLSALNKTQEYDVVGSAKPYVYSKSYLLMDSATTEVIVSKNADTALPIASTTKMTTALVAMELFNLDDVVTISAFPPKINGSKIGLVKGEKITVLNLLKGLLIYSGNDTAYALAEHYSNEEGNYQKFVQRMNEFVQNHNLNGTQFNDPAGLDDTGHSTAFDLANIARLLLNNKTLAQIVSTPETTIASTDGSTTHELKNTNRLILTDSGYYMPDVVGIKTGFTPDAGHCLISAEKVGDRYLIGVILNTDEYTITASASEMKKLFTWASTNWKVVKY